MADEEVVNPQEQAADNVINDFRNLHNDALLDTGHVEHSRRALELKGLYEKRYASEPTVFDPGDGIKRPENSVDEVAAEEMQPLRPHEFEIGKDSTFGLNVDQQAYGWDADLEREARATFANAAMNNAQARLTAQTYYETMNPAYNVETANQQSVALLKHEYGDQNVERALAGTNAMLKRLAGPQMYSYIARSGLGAHPRFVGEAVRVARQRGWWK